MDHLSATIFHEAFALFDSYIAFNQEYMQKFANLKQFGTFYFNNSSLVGKDGHLNLFHLFGSFNPTNPNELNQIKNHLDSIKQTIPSGKENKENFYHVSHQKETNCEPEMRDYKCYKCGFLSKSDYHLKIHQCVPQQQQQQQQVSSPPKEPLTCKLCRKRFSKLSSFLKHKQLHVYRMFKCDKCPRRFSQQERLVEHLRTHVKIEQTYEPEPVVDICEEVQEEVHQMNKLDCNLCGRQFNFSSHLKKHLQDHEADTMFPCYFCSQQFTNRPNLSNHIKSHAQPNGSYKCISCNHSFELFKDLKNHAKLLHDYQEKFICKKCNKSFHTLKHFRLHQKIHL